MDAAEGMVGWCESKSGFGADAQLYILIYLQYLHFITLLQSADTITLPTTPVPQIVLIHNTLM